MKTQFALSFILLLTSAVVAGQNNCFDNCWENLEIASKETNHEEFHFPYQKVLAYLEGCPMPTFYYQTIDGKELTPEILKGKVIVMNFWFESCTPCRNELPGLNKLAAFFKDKDVIFIAFGRDSKASIEDFLKRNEFNFYHVADSFNNGALDCLCVMGGFPTTMVFDKKGNLYHSLRGGSVDPELQYEVFDKLKPVIEQGLMQKG